MWQRNLLFFSLLSVGAISVAATLLIGERTRSPSDFRPNRGEEEQIDEVVAQIDAQFRQHWEAQDLTPTPRASDFAIARRISLGLTGTIPSLEEIRALEMVDSKDRLEWWVSHLLEDRRSADYMAERFTRAYVGVENGPFLVYRRRRFVTWLSDRLHQVDSTTERKMPYDEIVRTVLSDTGLWTGNPAVNFITVTMKENSDKGPSEITLASRTARAFLGVQLDCVQCHDDNLGGDWLQSDFHELAAFFADAEMSFTGIRDGKNPYQYTYLDEKEDDVPIDPDVPFNEQLAEGLEGTRRQRLAAWITHPENKPFARVTVNRVWAIMTGRPLVHPIDNLPIEGSFEEETFPPGLEILADDFASHGFDMDRLIRVIAATEVYQLESKASNQITPEHEAQWACFPSTRLRPEQVAGSVLQATFLKTVDSRSHIFLKMQQFGQTNEFVKRYGDNGVDEFIGDGGTIPQRLILLNGQMVRERSQSGGKRLAEHAPDDETAIEAAFLSTLTRKPSKEEVALFTPKLKGTQKDQRANAMEDIFWTLINTRDFSWNH